MRYLIDTLVGRTVLIMLLGMILIAGDVAMVFWLVVEEKQTPANWLLLILLVLGGIIFVAYIISRQLIKPLKLIASSAQRFSTDMQAEALTLNGPREVRETAHSINLMQQRIQRFVTERMQLVAAISHDLRTPLTRLRLRADTLTDPMQKHKALADIDEMNTMIQSTLAFIRNDAVHEPAVKIDLSALLKTICDDTSDTLGPARYDGPGECVMQCKPLAFKRALGNLVENGIKYGIQVEVNLQYQNNTATIEVIDRGPGITEQEIDNVFLPFYRIEKSRSRETGGAGLGLSVARTIIQEHGGDIRLRNAPNGGLIARVEVPVA